jgi:AraC-like DNA-binding protein
LRGISYPCPTVGAHVRRGRRHRLTSPRSSKTSSDNPDEFAASQPGYVSRYLPTTKDHRFLRLEVNLPSGRLLLVRRPPLIYEGMVSASRGLVTFLLEDVPRARVNGRHMTGSRLAAWRQGTSYRGYDEFPLTVCSLLVSDQSAEQAWLSGAEGYFSVAEDRVSFLRSRIRDIIRIADRDPARLATPNALKGIDQSIVGGINDALLESSTVRGGAALGRYVAICKRAQEYVNESRHRICSGIEMANACGVSVRTMHNAFTSVLGISPNRYLVLHRLWLTRKALLQSDDQILIKSIALEHGFWHLGRFSQIYYSRFGELPSTTLETRRRRAWPESDYFELAPSTLASLSA